MLMFWLLFDTFIHFGSLTTEGASPVIRTQKTVFIPFSLRKSEFRRMIVKSGRRLFLNLISPAELIRLGISISEKGLRIPGRRKRGTSFPVDFRLPTGVYSFRDIHLSASIRKAAVSGNFPNIRVNDILLKKYGGKGRISLIVVLDSSASMIYSIKGIADSLYAIRREIVKFRDRISLIVSKGFSSVILQHPTTNFYLFLGKLRRVGLDDFTPLASGLYKGLKLAIKEKRRGYMPILILISDGNVNVPLPIRLTKKYFSSDPSVQSLLEVGYLISKNKINTVIINTYHRDPLYNVYDISMSGTRIMLNLAKITRGIYIGIASR